MKTEGFKRLESIKRELYELDKESIEQGVSHRFLEVVESAGNVVTVKGNAEGLLYLAWCCLELGTAQVDGKRFHFDKHGMLDRADKDLVLSFEEAPKV